MPAKFQLNFALTRSQREMLDQIHASGRGPADYVVAKMLMTALEEYWERFPVLPSPMKIVPDVSARFLREVADAHAVYEAKASPKNTRRSVK